MKIFTKLSTLIAASLVFVAQIGVGTNSMWFLYEPDVPKSLKQAERQFSDAFLPTDVELFMMVLKKRKVSDYQLKKFIGLILGFTVILMALSIPVFASANFPNAEKLVVTEQKIIEKLNNPNNLIMDNLNEESADKITPAIPENAEGEDTAIFETIHYNEKGQAVATTKYYDVDALDIKVELVSLSEKELKGKIGNPTEKFTPPLLQGTTPPNSFHNLATNNYFGTYDFKYPIYTNKYFSCNSDKEIFVFGDAETDVENRHSNVYVNLYDEATNKKLVSTQYNWLSDYYLTVGVKYYNLTADSFYHFIFNQDYPVNNVTGSFAVSWSNQLLLD